MAVRAAEGLVIIALCAEWLLTAVESKSWPRWRRKG